MSDLFYYIKLCFFTCYTYQAPMFLYHINFKYKILIPNSEPSKSFEIILTPKQMYIFEIKSKLSSTEVGRMPESIVFLHAHV